MTATGTSTVTRHYHFTNDHCAEGVPLFGLTEDDQWSDEIVGYACSECWAQWFVAPIQSPDYTDSGYR
jgi:hypothetical protein